MDVIKVSKLKKYFGDTKAVDNITFSVKKGEIMGFLGPNGAGKTTTISCLMDFIRPDSGIAQILGKSMQENGAELRQKIGFLGAEGRLYDQWTGLEHILLFSQLSANNCSWEELVAKLDYDPSKKVHNLSTGNKQKLALILALMHKPEILIMDEPTTGLDPILQQTIYDILRERVEEGTTVFVSSHNLAEVEQICDRVVIINQGKIRAIESIVELQKKKIYTVFLYFEGSVPDKQLAKNGIKIERRLKNGLELTVRGEITSLLDKIKDLPIKDMQIRHTNLEKVFLEYYKN